MAQSNYIYAYREACHVLAERLDPEEIARLASCRFDTAGSYFELPFLGRLYRVSYPDGEVTPGDPLPSAPGAPPAPSSQALLTASILIVHYLTKARGTPLAGEWIAFRELPGGNVYVNPFTNRTIRPMVAWFGKEPKRITAAAQRLGGRRESFGHASASIDVFKMVPVCFVVWEGDDEVPSSGQILFDRSASDYLDTEDLVVAAGEALYAARSAAGPEGAPRPQTLEPA